MTSEDLTLYEDLGKHYRVDFAVKQYTHEPKVHILLVEMEDEDRVLCRGAAARATDLDPDLPLCKRCAASARRLLREVGGDCQGQQDAPPSDAAVQSERPQRYFWQV